LTPATTHKSPCGSPGTLPSSEQIKDKDEALVFVQDAKKDPKKPTSTSTVADDTLLSKRSCSTAFKKPAHVCCRSCRNLGHTLAVRPKAKPPSLVHAMFADADNASVASNASSIIILT
jgi:hypothetical protein